MEGSGATGTMIGGSGVVTVVVDAKFVLLLLLPLMLVKVVLAWVLTCGKREDGAGVGGSVVCGDAVGRCDGGVGLFMVGGSGGSGGRTC